MHGTPLPQPQPLEPEQRAGARQQQPRKTVSTSSCSGCGAHATGATAGTRSGQIARRQRTALGVIKEAGGGQVASDRPRPPPSLFPRAQCIICKSILCSWPPHHGIEDPCLPLASPPQPASSPQAGVRAGIGVGRASHRHQRLHGADNGAAGCNRQLRASWRGARVPAEHERRLAVARIE